ncbi:MAG: signal peptidase I [Lachnospiraceae bacterium]|nr:signal peptidase I [Candidatus Darwinimomas equi]
MSTKKYKKTNNEEKKEGSSVGKEILSWIEVFLIAAAIAFVVNRFLIANSVVPTGSMEPNIMSGERVFGSRLTYLNSDPQRGDIVIFRWPDNEKIYFVKRVIGLPGETVDIVQGKVYINGELLDEPYLAEPMLEEPPMHFEVPENAYFMMGDNRNNSADARYWDNHFVYRDKIIAKVGIKYWPFPIEKVE